MRRLLIAALGGCLIGCTLPPPADAEPAAGGRPGMAASVAAEPAGDVAAALQALRSEIGDAACRADAECRTIAVGNKPCGGPQAYLPWSIGRSNEQRIGELASAHAALQRAEQRRRSLVSDCAFVTDPGAACSANRCALRQGRNAGSL